MPWLLKFILFGNFILGIAFALVLFLSWLLGKMERRLRKSDIR